MDIQTIELLLDEQSDNAVRNEWQALEEAGLRDASTLSRPHITLTARRQIDAASEQVIRMQLATLPLRVRLGAPLLFGGHDEVILVRSIVPTTALLDLQARVHHALGDGGGVSATCLPGAWTPHVTLTRLRFDRVSAALQMIMKNDEREITLNRTRRWDGTTRQAWDLEPHRHPPK